MVQRGLGREVERQLLTTQLWTVRGRWRGLQQPGSLSRYNPPNPPVLIAESLTATLQADWRAVGGLGRAGGYSRSSGSSYQPRVMSNSCFSVSTFFSFVLIAANTVINVSTTTSNNNV